MNYNLLNMKTIAKQLNARVFTDWYYRLMLIARSIFEWQGLEEIGISEKWIEKLLFTHGGCVLFKDVEKGFMVARLSPNGALNHYDEPTIIKPYATNYNFNTELLNDVNCVIIRNNDDMIPTSPTIELYALKLANIDRTIEVNIHAQKTPIIVKCSERQKLTLKNVINQRADNEPVIFGTKDLDIDGIEILDLKAPMVFKELELEKHMILNEVMTFLGVNNANQDKRERLVTDEVIANNEQVEANINMMLRAREEACEKINKMFGTHLSVKRRISNKPIINSNNLEGFEPSSEGSESEVD